MSFVCQKQRLFLSCQCSAEIQPPPSCIVYRKGLFVRISVRIRTGLAGNACMEKTKKDLRQSVSAGEKLALPPHTLFVL